MESNNKYIVAVSRQFGTRGLSISKAVAEKLGVKIVDRNYLTLVCEKFNLTFEEIEKIKSQKSNWWNDICHFYSNNVALAASEGDKKPVNTITPKALYLAETQILKDFTVHESCVIVGRSACHIFKDSPNALKVFIHGPESLRLANTMEKYHVDEKKAMEMMEDNDKTRDNYVKTFSGKSRYDLRDYDLVINIDKFSFDEAVNIIVNAVSSFNK
ncbi:MAG: cytidylate kinase-like family protein [Prevotellaceae bacterium]|nr:cytidylate kinase-like family protein [Prevotellaceae bacterium]